MKRARPLFALVAPFSLAACMSEAPAWPLSDGQGRPACGNIGQVGRPTPRVPTARPDAFAAFEIGFNAGIATAGVSLVVATYDEPARRAPTTLVNAGDDQDECAQRPLTDDTGRPASGNVRFDKH